MKGSTLLPETLVSLMDEQGLTIKTLSEKSHVARSTIWGWTQGVKPMLLIDVRRVAHALGCTFEYLVFGSDESNVARLLNSAGKQLVLEGVYKIRIETIEGKK